MILQALTEYYETLDGQGKIARPGWAEVKVSWGIELSESGDILRILPLKRPISDGKKLVPQEMKLPAPVKKASGFKSNFLWENAEYLLGLPTKGETNKVSQRFETAKELHDSYLVTVNTPEANAIRSFFRKRRPMTDLPVPVPDGFLEDIQSGANLTFFFGGCCAAEYPVIRKAWQNAYDEAATGDCMMDLVTGEMVVPEKVHPSIKNVVNAQSSGAALVSFNAKAYESFEREQNINAPLGKATAFAYTTALNYLTADKKHRQMVGDMTVVFWSKDGEEAYQTSMDFMLDGAEDSVSDADLRQLLKHLSKGEPANWDGIPLQPANDFFILGLAPNAARVAVRFFERSSFGKIVANIKQHYDDIAIQKDHRNQWIEIPLWALLRETVNQNASDKSPSPQMAGDVMRAMLTGGRYPETMLNQTILRIRAEHAVTRGRAALIKAYLIRNTKTHPMHEKMKEAAVMALNTETGYAPYVLGRLFSVLEAIQETANPGINATIKDRYFNAACATPAAVFPLLIKLSNSHLKKMEDAKRIYYGKQLTELMGKLDTDFPKTLSLQEQGTMILGYYHQTQKRFEKKTTDQ